MNLNEKSDLRGGRPCWSDGARTLRADPLPQHVDILIVGAGIMGAVAAEHLAASGRRIAVVDRRGPFEGATAGSTALIMWAAAVPLTQLAKRIGVDAAARRWRFSFSAVEQLAQRINDLNIACGWTARPEIYLSGPVLQGEAMHQEAALRQSVGLPSVHCSARAIAERFAIAPRDGLVSKGSYEVDPVALSFGLLEVAQRHGATVSFPLDVARLEGETQKTRVVFTDGASMLTDNVILATGYEPSRFYLPAAFEHSSSYAIASKPGVAPAWRENALIWEAAKPYLYARSTPDGRVIIGGEDEDFADSEKRDAILGEKSGALQAKALSTLTGEDIGIDCAWASTFGGSPDGLPAIGRARHADNIWLAYGYGGNGVTFASVAATLLRAALHGEAGEAATWFDPYRFET